MTDDPKGLLDQVFQALQGYVRRSTKGLADELAALAKRIDFIPAGATWESLKGLQGDQGIKGDTGKPGADGAPGVDGKDGRDGADGKDGVDGAPGRDGADGKDGSTGENGKDGADGLPGKDGVDGKPGRDGVDGKDGAPGADGKDGPAGADGKPGNDGFEGKDGRDGVDGQPGKDGRDGIDGKDADPELIARLVAEGIERALPGAVQKAIEAMMPELVAKAAAQAPKPRDGNDGKDGKDGANGADGKDGRDAFELDIHEGIDSLKRYQRGEYATFRGGVWKAVRPTSPLPEDGDPYAAGWSCVIRGLQDADVALRDEGRVIGIALRLSDGEPVLAEMHVPHMIYRGVWDPEANYAKGDATSRDGSVWILVDDVQRAAPGTPGAESGWKLAVRRGRDGAKGDRGDRGVPGRDGK